MNKNAKKIIVNSITLTRVLGTIIMPILFNLVSGNIFILILGLILFTDALDGFLARKWKVSTIFGSLLDMTADKLFAFAILVILSTMFPVMIIPLILEVVIASINIKSTLQGSIGKSSYVGKIKTWIMGISMMCLLIIGLSPEISASLSSLNINFIKDIFENIIKHKDVLTTTFESTAVVSELITTFDYAIHSKKDLDLERNKNSIRNKINELKNDKELIKRLFDEKYFEKTKDEPLIKKLVPNYYKKVDKK